MSTDFEKVANRCSGMKKVLETMRVVPQFHALASNQGSCLIHFIKGLTLNDEELSQVLPHISDVGFPAQVQGEIMISLTSRERNEGGTNKNARLQRYETWINYPPKSLWDFLQKASPEDVVGLLIRFLLILGLRHPSCPTFGMIAAMSTLLVKGSSVVRRLSQEEKWDELVPIKKAFRQAAAQEPAPRCNITTLPPAVDSRRGTRYGGSRSTRMKDRVSSHLMAPW